jgi:hypothetical protein
MDVPVGCYRHPEVEDENRARHRLLELGLLTSRWLQIDFIRDDFLYPFHRPSAFAAKKSHRQAVVLGSAPKPGSYR